MATSDDELKPERYVDTRLKRGEARIRNRAAKVNLCFRMWHGDQYCYVNSKNALVQQNVSLDPSGGKPRHRMRQAHGATLLIDSVEHEVSFSTQRIPGYQVIPSNVSPQSIGAAKLSEKVARFGYDQWRLREVRERAVTSAVVAGEGFAWPFWDDQLGPPIPGTNSCVGDVRVRTYHPNEVMWEPGVRFEESAWHAIKQARPLDEIRSHPGFIEDRKLDLRADAQTNDLLNEPVGGDARNMAFVTEYLERPSPKAPQGRWLTYSNDRLIYPEQTYPCVDGEGKTVDEPVLHALQRIVDPAGDRAMGLVEHAVDPVRTYNNCWNKQLEWMNLTLIPQWLVPRGAQVGRWTDEPGALNSYNPIGGLKPERITPPPIPGDLEGIKQGAADEVRRLFASADVPSGVDAARAIQALIDRDENRRAGFVARLAAFDARMMRHCIYLVQRYYKEPRLLQIRGQWGPENLQDFTGADLRGQADIQVLPQSIEPRTREAVEQRVMNYAQLGWVTPEKAMEAIEAGTAETLIESYELDVARANRVIQRILKGPTALFGGQPAPDPANVQQGDPQTWPEWMPRPFDNLAVHKSVFSDFMKTSEYDTLPAPMTTAVNLYYQAVEQLDSQQQAQAQQAQAQQAAQMGITNAARPAPANTPLPSLPAVNGAGNGNGTSSS